MGSNQIGPEGPHLEEPESEPVTGGAAAKPKKEEHKEDKTNEDKAKLAIGPNGPHAGPLQPLKMAADIGPEGPH